VIPGLISWNRLSASGCKGDLKMNRSQNYSTMSIVVVGCVITSLISATGCQVALNGQTLPSPYYLQDDVQYFPSGPEFKLPREAAALRAAQAEEKLRKP
jgi:hypothetical protein